MPELPEILLSGTSGNQGTLGSSCPMSPEIEALEGELKVLNEWMRRVNELQTEVFRLFFTP